MDLREAAHSLFSLPVGVGEASPTASAEGLLPEEMPALAQAVEARRREFAAGRRAARAAMRALGHAPAPVPMRPDRSPAWPAGLSGSITHSETHCLAVVTQGAHIGLDIEPDVPLEPDLLPAICTPAELDWAKARPRDARFIFSAKESVYKCQYPLTGVLFDFHTLEIEPGRAGTFAARFLRRIGPFAEGTRIPGRFLRQDGVVLTAAEWRP